MDALHRFVFDGLPARGLLVRLEEGWLELLARRAGEPYPQAVCSLLCEMVAAAVLMQSNIKFDGRLVLQIQGDGPVSLAVAEVHSDLRFRATATVRGPIAAGAHLADMLDAHGQGRCAITLDPLRRGAGQQPYQGVVPLHGDRRERLRELSQALEHYMRQSEQLDTRLLLAANDRCAAGLLLQRLPARGRSRVCGDRGEDAIGWNEDFNRIARLAATLKRAELLSLDADTLLRRLFWEERVLRFAPRQPRFACNCSRQRVRDMLLGLGAAEVEGIVAERGDVEVGCEFCGQRYRFDAVDVGEMFTPARDQPGGAAPLQ